MASLPGWMKFSFLLNGLICTWDASFILLRPRTLPGGDLHHFWKPYSLYIQVDKRYGDMNDTFVYAVSLMNLCEVTLSYLILYLSSVGSKKSAPLAFTTAVMVWWKTVLYMLQYVDVVVGGGEYHAHNDLFHTVMILWVPNIIWIIVPFWIMVTLWPQLCDAAGATSNVQNVNKRGKSRRD